ncbi:hypothetical protein PENTCL1PPCAC_12455, partial [Pristionchus entomophagus]
EETIEKEEPSWKESISKLCQESKDCCTFSDVSLQTLFSSVQVEEMPHHPYFPCACHKLEAHKARISL